jgi:hypothetical protein
LLRRLTKIAILLAVCAAGCAKGPSPRWQQGGAQLPLASAYWAREETTVELRPNGEVVEEDEIVFRVDQSGRVSDRDGKPVAVLLPDGQLIAEDDTVLGWVGGGASYAGSDRDPGVYLFPTGQVVVADEDGEWTHAGRWTHCYGPVVWTCTLVTHVLSRAERARGGGGSSSNAGDVLKLFELLRILN